MSEEKTELTIEDTDFVVQVKQDGEVSMYVPTTGTAPTVVSGMVAFLQLFDSYPKFRKAILEHYRDMERSCGVGCACDNDCKPN